MAFLDKNGLQTLTNKLVQGDAIKVASHRGHTVKNVIDNIQRECENIATPNTMTLENRVNEFKVGKGRDVDVSGDVEEGKVEVELKGKTWQNLTGFGADFQAQHSSVFEKIDDEDSLLVKKISGNDSGWAYWCNNKLKRTLIKLNTKYTLLFKFDSNKNYNLQVSLRDGSSANPISNQINATRVFSNIYMAKLTTVSNFDGLGNGQVIYLHGGVPPKKGDWSRYYKDVILLEGDYTQTPIEELPQYFEGIKSSFEDGIVDVEVQGKNLFDKKTITVDKSLNNSGGSYENVGCNISDFIEVESNSSYVKSDSALYCEYDKDKNFIARYGNTTIVTSANCKYIRLNIISSKLENYQLEKGKIATPYEPYYKKKISFNIGEPLRSLPNGVCDEIRNNNGQWELVRRTFKKIVNSNNNWNVDGASSNNRIRCHCGDLIDVIPNSSTYCDKLSYLYPPTYNCENTTRSGSGYFELILNGTTKEEFLTRLNQLGDLEVIYELKTPIITPIEPMEFDVKPLATMTINSEIAPISNHKVVLNRAGQIEQGIVQIAELKKRVDSLETAYDSYLLETQHKLSILGFEYELESEEI